MEQIEYLKSEDAFEAEILSQKKILSNFFVFSQKEYFRLALTSIFSCIIMMIGCFCVDFKEIIIYKELSQDVKNLLKLIIFFATLKMVQISRNCFNNRKIQLGFTKLCDIAIINYTILSFLILIDRFLLSKFLSEWNRILLNNEMFKRRSLSWLIPILQLLLNPVKSCLYIYYEVINSTFVNICTSIFIASYLTPRSLKRFLKVILFASNIGPIINYIIFSHFRKAISKLTVSNFYLSYIFVNTLATFTILGLRWLSFIIDKEFSKQLFVPETIYKEKKKNLKKYGICEATQIIFNSTIFCCLAIMAFGMSCIDSFFNSYAGVVYESYAKYLKNNALPQEDENYSATKSSVAFKYSSKVFLWAGIVSSILCILPITSKLFEVYGLFFYCSIAPVFSLFGFIVLGIFAAINYPFNNNMSPLVFGIKINPSNKPLFSYECTFITLLNILVRIYKWVFYSIIKENINILISPDSRVLVKGIVDNIIGKGSKMFVSFWFIVLLFIFNNSPIYTLPISIIVFSTILIAWIIMNISLHHHYYVAIRKQTYITTE